MSMITRILYFLFAIVLYMVSALYIAVNKKRVKNETFPAKVLIVIAGIFMVLGASFALVIVFLGMSPWYWYLLISLMISMICLLIIRIFFRRKRVGA